MLVYALIVVMQSFLAIIMSLVCMYYCVVCSGWLCKFVELRQERTMQENKSEQKLAQQC